MTEEPEILLGRYRHYKGGEYNVVGLARHSESTEWMVLYQCLRDNNSLWVRPYDMFLENVIIEGKSQPRFLFLRPAEN